MRLPGCTIRYGRKLVLSSLVLAGTIAPGAILGFSGGPEAERIQATYAQDGNAIGVTLVIYNFTAPSEMQALAQAFEAGQDRALAAALSRTKALGNCSIAGDPSFDVAFIQIIVKPTGRQITFITNRRHHSGEVTPGTEPESFDLMVGQFDLNDTDNTKSTGFLYPASKLVLDLEGKFHYDLAGSPRSLVGILDSGGPTAIAVRQAPDEAGAPRQQQSVQ